MGGCQSREQRQQEDMTMYSMACVSSCTLALSVLGYVALGAQVAGSSSGTSLGIAAAVAGLVFIACFGTFAFQRYSNRDKNICPDDL